ncbi:MULTISPECIES: excinuclease ABC subunit UvrC [Methanobrevibacter]|uniref:excinuclease ABC subunit UvrC n=1 Tax=Methanobrevibacter TaxID=2172 RepID=UPI000334876D|nr:MULTISPECIES: excinuclease ABC subunit UvrC [Methanobrevibacter]AGN16705.1 excinuclease ABC C subunit UvrC [Methanobrevibacter sp. AbM4]
MATKVTSPDNLPLKPGVYIMKDINEEVIYVGKSKSLKKRVSSYFKDKVDRPKTRVLMNHFHSLEYIVTASEKEALILEANLIKKYMPKYNIRLKDDKQYPYVKITDEDFPRLIITRTIGKTGSYYGPFTDVGSVRSTVKFLKQLFKIRTCKNMDGPCLNYQINLCYAPCDGNITKEEYAEIIEKIDLFFQGKYNEIINNLKKEMKDASKNLEFEKAAVLRDQINSIEEVMVKQFVDLNDELDQDVIASAENKNNTIIVVLSIRKGKIISKEDYQMDNTQNQDLNEIFYSFIQQYYGINRHIPKEIIVEDKVRDSELIEDWLSDLRGNKVNVVIPQKGKKLRLIRLARGNADIVKKQKEKVSNALTELQNYLKLKNVPHVIEGYDVSNISGTLQVGSKVSFFDGKPNKKLYKRFKLETPGPNDYGMMRELLTRRFKSLVGEEDYKKPDLVLIDGGKGQLHVACEVLEELGLDDIPVIGLAKEYEEVFVPQSTKPIIIPHDKQSLHILQQVRDEAHRFGVTYHRKLRSKKITESELDGIQGIGKKRKLNLLRAFGNIDSISKASINELNEVDGMNQKVSENVYNHFHHSKI